MIPSLWNDKNAEVGVLSLKKSIFFLLALLLALPSCGGPAESGATPTPAPVPETTETVPTVYTDYSQLTPYEPLRAKYTRRYEDFTDTLIPADDYGLLVPFAGVKLTVTDDRFGRGWEDSLYGLMTLEGEVVADPVFTAAFVPSIWDESSWRFLTPDCLVLKKVVMDEDGTPTSVAALCARDGSWCTGFDYFYDWEFTLDNTTEDVIPLRQGGLEVSVFLDAHTGAELKKVDLTDIRERFPDGFWTLVYNLRYAERYAAFFQDELCYIFDTETGAVLPVEDVEGLSSFSHGLCQAKTASGWGCLDGKGRWVIDPVYQSVSTWQNGHIQVQDQEGRYHFVSPGGEILYTFPEGANSFNIYGSLISYRVGQTYTLLDKNLRPLPLPTDFTDPRCESDWLIQKLPDPSPTVPGGVAFWNVKTGLRRDFPAPFQYAWCMEGDFVLLTSRADSYDYTLADLATGETTPLGRWRGVSFYRDEVTGEPYLALDDIGGAPSEFRTFTGDTLCYTADNIWKSTLLDGKIFVQKDTATTLTTLDGETVFCWPILSNTD